MHYQAIVSKEDIQYTQPRKFVPTLGRHLLKLPAFQESILFEINEKGLLIIEETSETDIFSYSPEREYKPEVIPYLIALVCYLTGHRNITIGKSTHTVMVHSKGGDGRYVPTYEDGKVIMHEKEGVFFVKEEGYYTAVCMERTCDEVLKVSDRSLKLLPEKYLVRFNLNPGYVYIKATEVYADPVIRVIRNRHIPFIDTLNWNAKRNEINQALEEYTRPHTY